MQACLFAKIGHDLEYFLRIYDVYNVLNFDWKVLEQIQKKIER